MAASHKENRPLANMIFAGPPGCGKSSLPPIIAAERGVKVIELTGKQITESLLAKIFISDPSDCPEALRLDGAGFTKRQGVWQRDGSAIQPALLWVDEVDTVPPAMWRGMLYQLMEATDGGKMIHFKRGTTLTPVVVMPHSWVFTSNDLGRVQKAAPGARRRCGQFVESFQAYDIRQIVEIISQYAHQQGWSIEPEAAFLLASRSHGYPGPAIEMFKGCRASVAAAAERTHITHADAEARLELDKIDELGLNDIQQRYLKALYEAGGSLAIEDLSTIVDEPESTIRMEVERTLVRLGLVSKSSRGRTLTPRGYGHVARKMNGNTGGGFAVGT